MNRFIIIGIAVVILAAPGCSNRSESQPKDIIVDNRQVTVEVSPQELSVAQSEEAEFTVTVSRTNFTGPVDISFRDHPIDVDIKGN